MCEEVRVCECVRERVWVCGCVGVCGVVCGVCLVLCLLLCVVGACVCV